MNYRPQVTVVLLYSHTGGIQNSGNFLKYRPFNPPISLRIWLQSSLRLAGGVVYILTFEYHHKKKSRGGEVRSRDHGSQAYAIPCQIMWSLNPISRTVSFLLAVWHVASSCWSQVVCNFCHRWSSGNRNVSIILIYWSVLTFPEKKYGPMIPNSAIGGEWSWCSCNSRGLVADQ